MQVELDADRRGRGWPPETDTTVDDVGKAARDWPQIRFVVYHSAFRWTGGAGANARDGYAQFEQTGRVEWTTDLAEIPAKYGVSNVYADLGFENAEEMLVKAGLTYEREFGARLQRLTGRGTARLVGADG